MCTSKKKEKINKQDEQEKICVTWVHTIGDCELRSLLITWPWEFRQASDVWTRFILAVNLQAEIA